MGSFHTLLPVAVKFWNPSLCLKHFSYLSVLNTYLVLHNWQWQKQSAISYLGFDSFPSSSLAQISLHLGKNLFEKKIVVSFCYVFRSHFVWNRLEFWSELQGSVWCHYAVVIFCNLRGESYVSVEVCVQQHATGGDLCPSTSEWILWEAVVFHIYLNFSIQEVIIVKGAWQ